MFTLFKKRNFGDYVSDTFQFFKQNGKHYLKNYFTISGFILLLLVIVFYFLFQVYFDFFFKFDKTGDTTNQLRSFISDNISFMALGGLVLFLLIILLNLLNYSIPVIYLDLYDKNKGDNFGSKEILAKFKSNFGKILGFFLGTIFIIAPILAVFFGLLFYLLIKTPVLLIIGIPMFLFAIPTVFCLITLGFFEYLNNDKGFFEALGDGFKHISNQYFPIVGSTMTVFTIIYISMNVFSIILYIIGLASIFTSTKNPGMAENNPFSFMGIVMTIVMVISMLMGFILNNLLLINQGLVYYSRKEFDENVSSNDSIDLIGSE